MINTQTSYSTIEQKDPQKLGTAPLHCFEVELQVSPIVQVHLQRKKQNSSPYIVRTILDSGSGTNWCHQDLLDHVQYRDLGAINMKVEVFEGSREKRYRYVELQYTVSGLTGTLRCFVTDQYAWFNDIKGLTQYAASQLPGQKVFDPSSPCNHDGKAKQIALILGPYASSKLKNKNIEDKYVGFLHFQSYRVGEDSGYVFSGLLPKHLNRNVSYSYRVTPMLKEGDYIQGSSL